MKTCKIAFIATVYRHLEAFHLPFINLLQQKGCEVHAYASPDHGKAGVQKNHVICHDIPFQRSPFHADNVKAFKMLYQSFKEERFDLVHVHTPVAGILGRWAAKMTGIPCVMYTAHGFHFFDGAPFLNWLLYYPVERGTARWTDYLITINDEDYQRAKRFPVRKEVLYVPGVGVDISRFHFSNEAEVRRRKRQELGIDDHEFVVLSVAELIKRKNIEQLIDAIGYIRNHHQQEFHNYPIRCLIVGDGQEMASLKKRVKDRDVEDLICFLGFRRDVSELLIASDVIALLSKHEGLPKALLEALAAGKPIVTTDVRGNRDLVEDGVNGYVVQLGDVPETADSFMKLLKDENKRIQMGKTNRAKAKAYNLTNILAQMEKIYDKALSNRL